MNLSGSLARRIGRTFLLQAAAIGVAAVVSVLLAALVIRHVLVTEALRMEAEHFWDRRAADPAFPLPDTRNLRGHLVPAGQSVGLPPALRGLDEGFHDLPRQAGFTTVHVSARDGQRLYLVFDGERVDQLAAYFGLLPLMVVLVVLYLSVWLSYRASQRAVSPVTRLAREVNRLDPDTPDGRRFVLDSLPPDADDEVRVLASALEGLSDRLAAFVERERTFTRDASHELRTPLTVTRMATDLLLARDDLPEAARETVQRIRRSSGEMEQLVEAFLLLARESDQGLPVERLALNAVIEAELEQLRPLVAGKPVEVRVEAECALAVDAPEQALSAVVRNLLRNALTYTDAGQVTVRVAKAGVVIEDSGVGMSAEEVGAVFRPYFRGEPRRRGGHGVGLTIVRRFADRFGWTVDISSTPGVGTRVALGFPRAVCTPLPAAEATS
jgi:signal transduction histidine kinase